MKASFIILAFLSTCFYSTGYSQSRRLCIVIDVLPELKSALNSVELRLTSFDTSVSKRIFGISDTLLFETKNDSFSFVIFANIKSPYKKEFSLWVTNLELPADSTTFLKLIFPQDCPYNRHALLRKCPKCRKIDKVIPILYGLRMPLVNENGEVTDPDPPKYKPGGCNVSNCDPSWYCERDKLKF